MKCQFLCIGQEKLLDSAALFEHDACHNMVFLFVFVLPFHKTGWKFFILEKVFHRLSFLSTFWTLEATMENESFDYFHVRKVWISVILKINFKHGLVHEDLVISGCGTMPTWPGNVQISRRKLSKKRKPSRLKWRRSWRRKLMPSTRERIILWMHQFWVCLFSQKPSILKTW